MPPSVSERPSKKKSGSSETATFSAPSSGRRFRSLGRVAFGSVDGPCPQYVAGEDWQERRPTCSALLRQDMPERDASNRKATAKRVDLAFTVLGRASAADC